MGRIFHKKGMSPLIATILLIALAVSIGATVMSVGGIYYQEFREGKQSCSKAIIGTFELKNEIECKDYEFKSILNFYDSGETVKNPDCYNEIGSGKGNVCATSEEVFGQTWIPAKNLIK